jgi:hypothetical protein
MTEILPDRLLLLNGPNEGSALRLDQGVITVASPDQVGILRPCTLLLDPKNFVGVYVFFHRIEGGALTVQVYSTGATKACVLVNEQTQGQQLKLRPNDRVSIGDVPLVRAGKLEPLRLRLLAAEPA